MLNFVIDMLQCPQCRGTLGWHIARQSRERILEAVADCKSCASTYPVREGIALFLTPDLPRDDLWEQAESGLMQHLQAHPDVKRRLMDVPLESLGPADQFFRAMLLEERGDYAQAKRAADLAHSQLYTPEYLACMSNQRQFMITHVASSLEPIVDLASGRGDLVEALVRARAGHRIQVGMWSRVVANWSKHRQARPSPVIASDFSPRILRRDRRWLEFFGLYDQVSLLAFDARRTPFKDGVISTMTTNLGLPNIDQPEVFLPELRRIVSGRLLAISHFYPEDDVPNAAAIRAAGRSTMLFQREAVEAFAAAGWQAVLDNICKGPSHPTPAGKVLEGVGIDGLPVADTILEWGVLVAS
jgi:ubiquinone/menaquinone biosynthesis C-methylase UbiE/uncharacterized protein YbaR (Trm112 family)